MRLRSSPVLLALASSAAVLALVFHARQRAPEEVVPDPSLAPVPEVVAQPETPAAPEEPALGTPHLTPTRPKPHPKAKLDTVEPWHGEDLEQEVALAALERPHLDVDRLDPWNPSVYYPANPNVDPDLEDQDPWARSNGAARRIAKTTKSKAALESDDPWSSTAGDQRAKQAPADLAAPAL